MPHSRNASICFKAGIALLGAVGILLQIGIFDRNCSPALFRMFTLQSNLLVVLYEAGAVIYLLRHPDKQVFLKYVKFAVMLAILLTGLVSAVMLGNMLIETRGTMRISLILLHIVVPVGVLLDWILFDEKGGFTRLMALCALIFPLSYVLYIFVTAPFLEAGERNFSGIVINYRYPYPFLQVDRYGRGLVILCIIGLALLLYGLGLLLYRIDRRLASRPKVVNR